MARYTKVHTQFWTDEKVLFLSEDARTLFLYLMTCPHGNMLGIYVLPPLYACADLKWPPERYAKASDELVGQQLIVRDDRLQVIWLPNFLRHNPIENPSQTTAAIKVVGELPRSQLLADVAHRLEDAGRQYLKPLIKTLLARCPAQCGAQCIAQSTPQCATPVTVTVSVPVEEEVRTPPPPSPTPDGAGEGAGEEDKPNKSTPKTLDEILQKHPRYTPEQQAAIRDYWDVVRFTRKTARVSPKIVSDEMDYWERFPPDVVMEALSVHMRKCQGKQEDYTRGIMRRLMNERRLGIERGRDGFGNRQGHAGHSEATRRPTASDYTSGRYGKFFAGPEPNAPG